MFLVFDDVMDGSTTRRGQPCWHRMDGVGLIAINDALMIENGIYHILKKYFSHTEYYTKLVDLFREVGEMLVCCWIMDLFIVGLCVSFKGYTNHNYWTILRRTNG